MARTGSSIFSLVPTVRVVGVRKRTSPPRVLFDAELPYFLSEEYIWRSRTDRPPQQCR